MKGGGHHPRVTPARHGVSALELSAERHGESTARVLWRSSCREAHREGLGLGSGHAGRPHGRPYSLGARANEQSSASNTSNPSAATPSVAAGSSASIKQPISRHAVGRWRQLGLNQSIHQPPRRRPLASASMGGAAAASRATAATS